MSGISDLARSFEEKSKQQASAIETGVSNAYRQHEQTLLRALQSSEQTLNAAIQAREKSLSALLSTTEASTRALALSGWKWLAGSLLAVALASSGALWWTSQTLAENLALIEQQKATMARAQALGVQFHQDANGQFIVLPRGMKPATGWTFDNGHRQAIKLEK
jgi:hypothetical protein